MQPDHYAPPRVRPGDVVLWSHGGGTEEKRMPAFVTDISDRNLHLLVFASGYTNHIVKDGVYHIGDPLRKKGDRSRNGCWEMSEQAEILGDLLASCVSLRRDIDRLENQMTALTAKVAKIGNASKSERETAKPNEPVTSATAAA